MHRKHLWKKKCLSLLLSVAMLAGNVQPAFAEAVNETEMTAEPAAAVEAVAPETQVPETAAPETQAPETTAPEIQEAETAETEAQPETQTEEATQVQSEETEWENAEQAEITESGEQETAESVSEEESTAESDSEVETESEIKGTEKKNQLIFDNHKDEKAEDYISISVERSSDFDEGMTGAAHLVNSEELKKLAASLEQDLALKNPGKVYHAQDCKAFSAWLVNPEGTMVRDLGEEAELKIFMKDALEKKDSGFYLLQEDGSWEKLIFTAAFSDGDQLPHITCKTRKLGTFLFAKTEEAEEYPENYVYEDRDVTITAVIAEPEKAEIPADAVLNAVKLEEGSKEYQKAVKTVEEAMHLEEGQTIKFIPYDIFFETSDGEKTEPKDGIVSIRMEFKRDIFGEPEEGMEAESEFAAHIKGDGQVEQLEDYLADQKDAVAFEVSSFSVMGPVMLLDADQSLAYGLLYDSGELVLQRGNTPDPDKGTLVQTWADIENNKIRIWYNNQSVKAVTVKDPIQPKTMNSWFYAAKYLSVFNNAEKLDTSEVTSLFAFLDQTNVKSINMSTWDTRNCKDYNYIFYGSPLNHVWIGPNTVLGNAMLTPNNNTDKIWKRRSTGELLTASAVMKINEQLSEPDEFGRIVAITFDGTGNAQNQAITLAPWESFAYAEDTVKEPSASGYTFDGWYTERGGKGTKLEPGTSMDLVRYYANWIPNTYTLTLKANIPEVQKESIVDMVYGKGYQLSDSTFKREGYVLASWNTRRNGSGTSYGANELVSNLTGEDGGTAVLYAQWKSENQYAKITFDSQGGNEIESRRAEKGAQLGELPSAQKEGFDFIGWHMNSLDGDLVKAETIVEEDLTLVAEWQKRPVVTFVSRLEGEDPMERSVQHGSKIGTLPEYVVTADQPKTFIGWFTRETDGTQITSEQIITEDVTYYAHWGYRPKWDTNGGKITGNDEYPIQDDPEYPIQTAPAAVRDGYTFAGWYLADGTEVAAGSVVNLEQGAVITAKWEKNPVYTVSFDVSGGKFTAGTDTEYTVAPGTELKGLDKPTKSGYTFAGWADAGGNLYQDGNVVNSDLKLTAQWKKNDCTITFDPGTGATMDTSLKKKTVASGEKAGTLPGAYLKGSILEGWYTKKDGQGEKLTEDTVINGNVTYYAYYVPVSEEKEAQGVKYSFGAQWVNTSGADVSNVGNTLEWHVKDYKEVTSSLRVVFDLTDLGGKTFPKESIRIRIPKQIWEDKNGTKIGKDNLKDLIPQYPTTAPGADFSYIVDGDDYVLVNNKEINGNVGLDLTINYTAPNGQIKGGAMDSNYNYIDGYEFYQGTVPVTVAMDTNEDNLPDIEDEKALSVEMHTYVDAPIRFEQSGGATYNWNPSWGPEPADADDYFYVCWNEQVLNQNTNQSQDFTFAAQLGPDHDGTLVKIMNEEPSVIKTNSGSAYVTKTYVMKYPLSMLEGKDKVTVHNQGIAEITWASGYKQSYVTDRTLEIKCDDAATAKEGFGKNAITTLNTSGYQDRLVFEEEPVTLNWTLSFVGGARRVPALWNEKTNSYSATEKTIELCDGKPGDMLYSSGSASNPTVCEPDTGNIVLSDNDYCISKVVISLAEYDAKYQDGFWSAPWQHGNTGDYDGVDLYVRYRNSDSFTFYKTVKGSGETVVFPANVVGYRLIHDTKFYKTKLSASADFVIYPTNHIVNLVANDLNSGVKSIFKDKAYFIDTDYDGQKLLDATNFAGGEDSAAPYTYALGPGKVHQYTAIQAESAVLDAENAVQNDPMVIAGWNYNTASGGRTPMTSGIFYNLLPENKTVDETTIYGLPITGNAPYYDKTKYGAIKASGNKLSKSLYDVSFVENWQDSGRTMMIIKWSAPADVKADVKATGMRFGYLLQTTYDDVNQHGTAFENDVALINTSERKIVPDERYGSQKTITEAIYYDGLQAANSDYISYAKANTQYSKTEAYFYGFSKTVKGQGSYNVISEVLAGDSYQYKLVYKQAPGKETDAITFFDVLEYGSESEEGEFRLSDWHGTLKSIDVSALSSLLTKGSKTVHCKPVVYYATVDRASITDDHLDVSDGIWTKDAPADLNTVTAIAVDCTKNEDGSDFVLEGKNVMSLVVKMTALTDIGYNEKYAHNQGKMTAGGTANKARIREGASLMKSNASIKLKVVDPEIHKTADPETGTKEEPKLVFTDTALNYNLSVKNPDETVMLYNIGVEDQIPEGLSVDQSAIMVRFEENGTWVKLTSSPRISMTQSSQKLAFTIASLAPGETAEIQIPSMVTEADKTLVNTAKVIRADKLEKDISSETTYHRSAEYKQFTLKIRKENASHTLIDGATMQLTGRDLYSSEDMEPIEWVTVAEEEKVIALEPGNYVLTEKEAPAGYKLAAPIEIYLSKDMTVTMVDESSFADCKISNTVNGSMGDKSKEFEYTMKLDDDKITSLTYVENGAEKTLQRNEDGTFHFSLADQESVIFKIPVGTGYEIRETNADGYKVTSENAKGTVTEQGINASFTNTKNGTVPTAAHMNTPIMIIIMICAACLLLLSYRKLKKAN